ncbi:MAG: aldolase/citrate lyase family protein [Spirochaetaceae bacterium]|nr:aldolase/citrate lyase family protein [Spirochaetaceae bacterium]
MRTNSLRNKLNTNEISVCTRIFNPDPVSVEVLGQTRQFDYVEFVAEYGSFDLHDLDNVCRTAELYGLGSMIKIDQSHQAFLAQRGIGAGFEAVLFTDCRSAEDVRECVRVARPDTPEDSGLYGAAARRNVPMGSGGSPAYVQAIRDIVVAVMIEKKGAVDELEEILAIPGLDMVQWGATDYSMNTGHIGERDHPEVREAHDLVFRRSLECGVHPRAEIGSPDLAQKYLDLGVRHFSIGADVSILGGYWSTTGAQLRDVLGVPV